ncbi:MAG: hypothetical protein NTW38_01995 [Candidatus Aminicenantes bacterium]|nr:hypothetical protein [Candidatus Aminicenantes bacterium]
MRKTMILVLAVGLVVGLTACKKGGEAASDKYAALGKYAEVGPVMDGFIGANEAFVATLDKATSADDVAAALDAVTAKLTELGPKMKSIGEKFPEFKTQDNPPAELKPFMDRLEAIMGKLMGAMGKAAPFLQDPKVVAAQERYNKVMSEMK